MTERSYGAPRSTDTPVAAANYRWINVDQPQQSVLRVTLNRPDKRNALSNELRGELFAALERGDRDPCVQVMVIRGAGSTFCSGYDLAADLTADHPYYTAGGYAMWARHVVEGCFRIWDLAKPVIAQVHGYCLAGGSELAAACDLVYVAEDARIGYPPVRAISPPDNQYFPWMIGMRRAMEMMLTGDSITGREAAEYGLANRAFPATELEQRVLEIAARVAKIPADIQQMNKRSVHRQMEAMGMRAGIRWGTELQMLGNLTASAQAHIADLQKGVAAALSKRDQPFSDYRTTERKK